MKLFDEKGKLFGKINIIDLLVILVVAAALIVVGVKVLGGNKADQPPSSSTDSSGNSAQTADPESTPVLPVKSKLTYTVRVTAQHKEIAEHLAEYIDFTAGKKDQIMHSGVMIEDAYVVDFWTEPCRYNVTSDGAVEMIAAAEAEAAGLVDLCFVVESVVPDAITSKVGVIEVRIGKEHILKTAHLEFVDGVVVDCQWEPLES